MLIQDKVPIEFDKWDNNPLRIFLTDTSFCAVRALLSVWWLLLCWAPVSYFNCLEQAGICCVLPA